MMSFIFCGSPLRWKCTATTGIDRDARSAFSIRWAPATSSASSLENCCFLGLGQQLVCNSAIRRIRHLFWLSLGLGQARRCLLQLSCIVLSLLSNLSHFGYFRSWSLGLGFYHGSAQIETTNQRPLSLQGKELENGTELAINLDQNPAFQAHIGSVMPCILASISHMFLGGKHGRLENNLTMTGSDWDCNDLNLTELNLELDLAQRLKLWEQLLTVELSISWTGGAWRQSARCFQRTGEKLRVFSIGLIGPVLILPGAVVWTAGPNLGPFVPSRWVPWTTDPISRCQLHGYPPHGRTKVFVNLRINCGNPMNPISKSKSKPLMSMFSIFEFFYILILFNILFYYTIIPLWNCIHSFYFLWFNLFSLYLLTEWLNLRVPESPHYLRAAGNSFNQSCIGCLMAITLWHLRPRVEDVDT